MKFMKCYLIMILKYQFLQIRELAALSVNQNVIGFRDLGLDIVSRTVRL